MSVQKFQCESLVRAWADAASDDGVELPGGAIEKLQGTGDHGPVEDLLVRACFEMEMNGDKLQGPNGEPPNVYFAKQFASAPHWAVAKVTDAKHDAWLAPTLNGRATRYNELLREYDGDKQIAQNALEAEAKEYRASLGNLKAGTAPEKAPDGRTRKNGKASSHNDNPWWRLRDHETGVVDQVVAAECGRIMTVDKAMAIRLAAAAGVNVMTGIPLKGA